nr:hypothetical protein [Candidatus Sigynarchaeota archaeon]
MESDQAIEWLKHAGSPAIRCWIARELQGERDTKTVKELFDRMMQCACARKWLDLVSLASVHGSKPACFENVVPKLAMLGLRPETPEFQDRCEYWLGRIQASIFEDQAKRGETKVTTEPWSFKYLEHAIIAGILAYAGFANHPKVAAVVANRLDTVHSAITRGAFDPGTFYLKPDAYARLPRNRQHDVINPACYRGGNFVLPWIYDILGFIGLQASTSDQAVHAKIESIVEFILSPVYQQLRNGYGVVMARANQGYAMGWSVHVPGFFGLSDETLTRMDKAKLVLLLDVLGNFRAGRAHPWYREGIAFLERYRASGARYMFPREYIDERPAGYWVNGAYMGMGADHADATWRESLSTFWMLKIKAKNRGA